jgi:uncharacterized LabA/DUF88 family protein
LRRDASGRERDAPIGSPSGRILPVSKKTVVFVDGENLVLRYQEMLASGHVPRKCVRHVPDCFVWSPKIFETTGIDLIRINYYTHVVGDDAKVADVVEHIADTPFSTTAGGEFSRTHLIPRVHKKPKQSQKTKVVDVDITMDIMRAALTMPIDVMILLSGDGDYVPLIREVARSTSKQVFVGAFSSGLADQLMSCAEDFFRLDEDFFEPPLTSTSSNIQVKQQPT